MNAIDLIRGQLAEGHDVVEQAVDGVNAENLHRVPAGGTIGSMAAIYAHTVFSEDWIVQKELMGREPLAVEWEERIGLPTSGGIMTSEWAMSGRLESLDAFREYARAVYAATDAYLDTLSPEDLTRPVELEGMSPGYTVGTTLVNVLAWHAIHHGGELCALKGIMGEAGLPF